MNEIDDIEPPLDNERWTGRITLPLADPEHLESLDELDAAAEIIAHIKSAEPTIPTKREFTIEIITELITPVVVWATTQEEAEHLALEQFKLAAGDGERESSESLAQLWSVIGEGGSRLTSVERVQIVQVLSEASYWSAKYGYTIGRIFLENAEQCYDYELQDFTNCTKPINWETLDTVFGFTLSAKECWDAIREITLMELASMVGVGNE